MTENQTHDTYAQTRTSPVHLKTEHCKQTALFRRRCRISGTQAPGRDTPVETPQGRDSTATAERERERNT